jgi:hypothetical protein
MTDFHYHLLGEAPATVEESDAGLVHVTDHETRGLARLIQQFQGKPRIASLLRAPLAQVQDLEDALWSLLAGRALSTAVGVQLDGLGQIVGEGRVGLGDDDYRALIRARIVANRSDGQGDTLLRLARLVLGTTVTLRLREYPPASVLVVAGDPSGVITDSRAEIVRRLLAFAAAGGVRVFFGWTDALPVAAFLLTDAAIVPDSATGLDDATDLGTGGALATVVE